MGQAIVFCGLPTQTTKNDRLRHKTRGTVLSSYFLDSALDFQARPGNLWVTGGSAQGLSEEAVELAAGGVKGALLVLPAVVD